MFFLYSILYTLSFAVMSPLFLLRKDKYAAGFMQRLGNIPKLDQDKRIVVWIHCVSVGETNAARSLVDEITKNYPNVRVVFSTTTKTGQQLAKRIFAEKAAHIFYFPFDWKFSVRKALKRIEPDVVLVFETEIWLNFFRETRKSGANILIVNGRLSEKSMKRYSWIRNTMKRVFGYIDLSLMQDHVGAKRMIELGANSNRVKVTGNLKFDQIAGESETDANGYIKERFGISENAPLIVAASTHAPEEKWILEAFKETLKSVTGKMPRLLIAPRHPERFGEVEKEIRKTGFDWVRRSEAESDSDKTAEIILLDSIGELRDVYSLAEIVFVGGSLIPHGGQSPLEPAIHEKAIITGFHTMNFEEVVRAFVEKDAMIQLPKLDEKDVVEKLRDAFCNLLKDHLRREELGKNAYALMRAGSGATRKTLENLKPYLAEKRVKTPLISSGR